MTAIVRMSAEQRSRLLAAQQPLPSGKIFMSNDDYNANSVDSKLTRIEGKLDALTENRLNHEARIIAMDARIAKLEQFAWRLAGALAIAVFALNYFKK